MGLTHDGRRPRGRRPARRSGSRRLGRAGEPGPRGLVRALQGDRRPPAGRPAGPGGPGDVGGRPARGARRRAAVDRAGAGQRDRHLGRGRSVPSLPGGQRDVPGTSSCTPPTTPGPQHFAGKRVVVVVGGGASGTRSSPAGARAPHAAATTWVDPAPARAAARVHFDRGRSAAPRDRARRRSGSGRGCRRPASCAVTGLAPQRPQPSRRPRGSAPCDRRLPMFDADRRRTACAWDGRAPRRRRWTSSSGRPASAPAVAPPRPPCTCASRAAASAWTAHARSRFPRPAGRVAGPVREHDRRQPGRPRGGRRPSLPGRPGGRRQPCGRCDLRQPTGVRGSGLRGSWSRSNRHT